MKLVWLMLLVFPLFAYCAAGIIELRSDKDLGHKLATLISSLLGIPAFAMACGLGSILRFPTGSIMADGRTLAMLSGIIASSGAFLTYSRKISAVLMALGGLALMFLYIFFNEATS